MLMLHRRGAILRRGLATPGGATGIINNRMIMQHGPAARIKPSFGVAAVGKVGGRMLFQAYCPNVTKIMPLEKNSGYSAGFHVKNTQEVNNIWFLLHG